MTASKHAEEPSRTRQMATSSAETLQRFAHESREEMKRPTFGAALAGAAVVGAAVTLGVGEAAIGALAAYVVYRILKERRSAEPAAQPAPAAPPAPSTR